MNKRALKVNATKVSVRSIACCWTRMRSLRCTGTLVNCGMPYVISLILFHEFLCESAQNGYSRQYPKKTICSRDSTSFFCFYYFAAALDCLAQFKSNNLYNDLNIMRFDANYPIFIWWFLNLSLLFFASWFPSVYT